MSPVFAARRRADEFQAMVEGTSTDRGSDARLAEFLELVETLRETTPVSARPDFVLELREHLLDEARTIARTGKGIEAAARLTVVRSTSDRRRERRLAAAVGGLALVGASTGMAVASQSALPGDPLYPLKRAIENAQTSVQADEDAKGKTLLENASGRLDEVDQLSRESDDADTIAATLQTFTDQASEASELLLNDYAETGKKDSVEELRSFTADSMAALTALETVIPEDARASLIKAAQTLTQIDQQALMACPTCGPSLITEIPTFTNVALADLLNSVNEVVSTTSPPPDKQDKPQKDAGQNDDGGIPVVDSTEGPSGKPGDNADDDGLIKDTIDGLTGKGDGKNNDDDDAGVLEGLTDGIAGLTGGLLGN
jgi:hypothetical protein